MTTKRVGFSDLPKYVGKWISYTWSDGWDDYWFSGYLHGIDEDGYVFLDDRPTLKKGERFNGLGGTRCDSRDQFDVYLTGNPNRT